MSITSPEHHETTSLRPPSLLRLPEVMRRTGLASSTVYWRMKKGTFPRPIKLNSTVGVDAEKVSVAWREDEIDRWIKERMAAASEGVDA